MCLIKKKKKQSNSVQPSIRHCDLLPSHRHWLGRIQSVLTQVERISEPDAVRYRVSPLSPVTCWPASPEFFGWPLIQRGRQMQTSRAMLPEPFTSTLAT